MMLIYHLSGQTFEDIMKSRNGDKETELIVKARLLLDKAKHQSTEWIPVKFLTTLLILFLKL